MALSFSRKLGTAIYVLEDPEAGYYREVKLEDVLEKVVAPAIYQAGWFITTAKVGVHPDGSPRDDSRSDQTRARQAGESGEGMS